MIVLNKTSATVSVINFLFANYHARCVQSLFSNESNRTLLFQLIIVEIKKKMFVKATCTKY